MTSPSLGERMSRRHDELRQERLESSIRRIGSLPPPAESTLAHLSVNPRLREAVLSDDAALWPLRVLALPKVPEFDKLEAQTLVLLDRINAGAENAPDGPRKEAAQTARDRLRLAYLFLRWPQNRELAAEALARFSGERPSFETIPLPSVKESLFGLLGAVLKDSGTKQD